MTIQIDTQYHLDRCTTPAEYYAQMTQRVPGEQTNDQKPKPAPVPGGRWCCGLLLAAALVVALCMLAGLVAGML